jgi:hypothetical protein
MKTQPNTRLDTAARQLELLAHDTTRALEHIHTETAAIGLYPSDTLPERTSGGGPARSPLETDTMLTAYQLRSSSQEIRDWIDTLETCIHNGRTLIDNTLRTRLPGSALFDPTQYADRCAGTTNPTCTNWASPHHTINGTTINTWCSTCWPTACKHCGTRPTTPGRTLQHTPACEACYRRNHRNNEPSTT